MHKKTIYTLLDAELIQFTEIRSLDVTPGKGLPFVFSDPADELWPLSTYTSLLHFTLR